MNTATDYAAAMLANDATLMAAMEEIVEAAAVAAGLSAMYEFFAGFRRAEAQEPALA